MLAGAGWEPQPQTLRKYSEALDALLALPVVVVVRR